MIKNKTLNFEYPSDTVYLVEISSKETATGEILLNVRDLNEVITSSVEIFKATPPDVLNSKWTKMGSDLNTLPVFNLEPLKKSSGKIVLNWRLDALELGSADGEFYTINLLINDSSNSETAQANIVFNVKITDISVVEA